MYIILLNVQVIKFIAIQCTVIKFLINAIKFTYQKFKNDIRVWSCFTALNTKNKYEFTYNYIMVLILNYLIQFHRMLL